MPELVSESLTCTYVLKLSYIWQLACAHLCKAIERCNPGLVAHFLLKARLTSRRLCRERIDLSLGEFPGRDAHLE